jgi:aminopeptidase N
MFMRYVLISAISLLFFYSAIAQTCEEAKKAGIACSFSRPTYKNLKTWYDVYDQQFVQINMEANDSNTYITNTVKYKLRCKQDTIHQVYFEFSPTFTIDSVSINNETCSKYYSNDTIILYPNHPIAPNSTFWVSISYHGVSSTGGQTRGLTNTYTSVYNQHITWTLSESFHLKDWLPCKQDLTDKLDSAWIFITVDSTCKAGSEGVLTAITDMGNGKKRYEWKEHHHLDYYLLSIAVGKYAEYDIYAHLPGMSDSLLVMNYIYSNPQCLIDNKTDINRTVNFLQNYSDKFGLYPFHDEKYGHSQVPLGGGMEHQTMTTLGNFAHWLVAHEMAHSWFGDNITCANWQDIWVNEGFASYGEYLSLQYCFDQQTADVTMRHFQWQARIEPAGSIYVPFDVAWDENRIFNGNLSYKKGACLIHMMRYLCNNDTLFFNTLKQIQQTYKDSVLVGADVRNLFESYTGIDFHPLFDQYYYGKGYPILNITWKQDSTANGWTDITIHIDQHGSSGDSAYNLFTIPLPFRIFFANHQDTLVKLTPNQNIQTFDLPTNMFKVDSIKLDPQNWILDSLESLVYAKPLSADEHLWNVYPNPAKDYITIDALSQNEPVKVEFYNAAQKMLFQKQITHFPAVIELNNSFSNGIYFLKLYNKTHTSVKKVVVLKD